MTTAQDRLNQILPSWYDLLTQWSLDGSLVAAATDALMLDGSNAKEGSQDLLQGHVSQWSAGNFSLMPQIILLSESDISGAHGAYAYSTNTIYLNQDWLLGASKDDILKILTEELGHYLDHQMNKEDVNGDEGDMLSRLVTGEVLTTIQKEAIRSETDRLTIVVNGEIITAEAALATVIRGNSFYTIVEGASWSEAENNASIRGGNLATIEDGSENDFLTSIFGPVQRDGIWIGLTDLDIDGNWEWSSGSTSAYRNWYPGEPNGNNSTWLEVYAALRSDWGGRWNDWRDANPQPVQYGIAEVPLNLTTKLPTTITEGAGEFTVNIELSAGNTTQKHSLLQGARVWYVVSGIDSTDLEAGYALNGSGVIDADGNIVIDGASSAGIKLALKNDSDQETDAFNVRFYSADPLVSTEAAAALQIGPESTQIVTEANQSGEESQVTSNATLAVHDRTYLGGPDIWWNGNDDQGNTLFIYEGGDTIYTAGSGVDGLRVDFTQGQSTLTKRQSGAYDLSTPSGRIRLYDFEYLYFTDKRISLDSTLHERTWRYGGPWNGNDDWGSTLFAYEGGNQTYHAGDGNDGLEIGFDQGETSLSRLASGGYLLRTPSGLIDLYDFEHIYFNDSKIAIDNSPVNSPALLVGDASLGEVVSIQLSNLLYEQVEAATEGSLRYYWESSTDGITWSRIATLDALDGDNSYEVTDYTLNNTEAQKQLRGIIEYIDINDQRQEVVTLSAVIPRLHDRTYVGGPDIWWNGNDDQGNTLFIYEGGDTIYTAGSGVDGLRVDFTQGQSTLTKRQSGAYDLSTPSGRIRLYDFEYLYFTDKGISLDSTLHERTWRYGGPWNGNDDWGSTLFAYEGGNQTYHAGDGNDGLEIGFDQGETSLSRLASGGYLLRTPSGLIDLYDFEHIYFNDSSIALASSLADDPTPQDKSAISLSGSYLSMNSASGDHLNTGKYYVPEAGDFTVSVWAKAYSVDSGRWAEILSQGYSGSNGFYIGYDPSGYIRVGDSWYPTPVQYPTDDAWHNFQVVKQGSQASLYLDGKLVASRDGFQNPQGGSFFRIGQQFDQEPNSLYNEYFNGAVDEVKIFASALSKADLDLARSNQTVSITPVFSSNFENGLTAVEADGSVVNLEPVGSPSILPFSKEVQWVDWTSADATSRTVLGSFASSSPVQASMFVENGWGFVQTDAGINYFNPSTPFESSGVSAPSTSDIVALISAGRRTVNFSSTVNDLYLAFVSTNSNNFIFDQDFEIVSQTDEPGESGYFGSGTAVREEISIDGKTYYQLLTVAGEPHGVIRFKQPLDSLSWVNTVDENWYGVTLGIASDSPATVIDYSLPNNARITAAGSGTVDGISFSSVDSIDLAQGNDTASLGANAGLSGQMTVSGGDGVDTLNGNEANNTLILSGLNSGTLDGLEFNGFENISLGGGDDSVYILPGGQLSGTLDGGGGSNTLLVDPGASVTIGTAGTVSLDGGGAFSGFTGISYVGNDPGVNTINSSDDANNLTVTGVDSGVLDGTSFVNAANINLFGGDDIVSVSLGGFLSGRLNGDDGIDSLYGNDADNILVLTGINEGTLDGIAFSGFENVYLGGGNDRVYIKPGGQITGILDGGSGATSEPEPTPIVVLPPGEEPPTGGGGTDGGGSGSGSGGNDQPPSNPPTDPIALPIAPPGFSVDGGYNAIYLSDSTNTLNLTGAGDGVVDGTVFNNFYSIDLRGGDDVATISDGGSLLGTLDGGEGTDQLLLNDQANALTLDHHGTGRAAGTAIGSFEQIDLADGDDAVLLDLAASTSASDSRNSSLISGGAGRDAIDLNISSAELAHLTTTGQLAALRSYLSAPTGQSITISFLSSDLTLTGFEDGGLNNAPTNLSLSPVPARFYENLPVGTAVASFSTVDPDAGDSFTYSLVDGEGDADNTSFYISGNQLLLADVPDYESHPYPYAIRVRSTDAGGLSVDKTFSLQVLDLNEAPPNPGSLSLTNFSDSGTPGDLLANDRFFDLNLSGADSGISIQFERSTDSGLSWSSTPSSQNGIADGSYSFRARVTNLAGYSAFSNSIDVTIDSILNPGTFTLSEFTDSGNSSDRITNDTSFSFIIDGSDPDVSIIYERSTDSGVTWSTTNLPLANLAQGDYLFRARLSDAAGNIATSNQINVTVDTEVTAGELGLDRYTIDTGTVTGTLSLANFSSTANGGLIGNDTDFALVVSGNEFGSALSYQVSTNGGTTWNATSSSQRGIADGTYWLRAQVTDLAGNVAYTNSLNIVIDTAAIPGSLSLSDFSDSGNTGDRISNDKTFSLVLDGQELGSTVIYQRSIDAGVTWIDIASALQQNLADASYLFRAKVSDSVGNVAYTDPINVTVDTTAATPNLLLESFVDNGTSSSDLISNDSSFFLNTSGAESGASIIFERSIDNGTTWVTTTASQENLSSGSYLLRAVATDIAGNIALGDAVAVTVDTNTPNVPGLVLKADNGSSSTDRITNDSTILVSSLEVSSTWLYSIDGGSSWSQGTGNSFQLPQGSYNPSPVTDDIQVLQVDLAGNSSAIGLYGLPLTIDTTPPSALTLALAQDTSSPTDGITSNNTLLVTGLENGAIWQYSLNGGSNWSAGSASSFLVTDGSYPAGSIRVRQSDTAGNVGAITANAAAYTIDTSAPVAPLLNATSTSTTSTSSTTIYSKTGIVSVSAIEPGNRWEFSSNGGTTWIPGTGSAVTLSTGTYAAGSLTARQIDPAGNISPLGNNAFLLIVDTTIPMTPTLALQRDTGVSGSDGITNNATVAVSGLLSGASWQYTTTGGTTWSNGIGSTFNLAAGTYGAGAIQVKQTNLAGTTSFAGSNGSAYTIDLTAPATPAFSLAADTGASATDRITNNPIFNVTGLEANARWEYSSDSGITWLSGSGTSFSLADGTYAAGAIRVRQSDRAGNTSAAAVTTAVTTIDTTPPGALSFALSSDTGISSTDQISGNGAITVSGLISGNSWQFTTNGGSSWSSGSGNTFTLVAGTYAANSVQVRQSDPAGNISPISSNTNPITIDATLPLVTTQLVGGTTLILRFSEPVAFPGATAARFAVRNGNTNVTVNSVAVDPSGLGVTLGLGAAITSASLLTVAYTDSSRNNDITGVIEDLAGNDLATRNATTIRTFLAASSTEANMTSGYNTGYTGVVLTSVAGAATIIGNTSANELTGNASNNTMTGGGGADIITGGGGSDTFRLNAFSDSLLGSTTPAYDRILDLAIGTDTIDVITTFSAALGSITNKGTVSALTSAGISAVLTSSTFVAGAAAAFSLGSGSSRRDFLAFNDNTAGYNANIDAIVEITGFSGNLTSLSIT